jgi:hypothetical protein
MGSGPSPFCCGVFPPPPLLQAFPLLVVGRVPPLLPSPAGLFIYSSVGDCPSPPLQHSGCPTLFATCLFCCCLLFSFSFFPGWGSVCSGCYADLAQGCLWEYCVLLTLWSASSQAVWALASGSSGALLVSPFNIEWECYVRAGAVEESKFCIFSVVFPVRCISSISPKFYFRNHTFCFLSLVTILDSLAETLLKELT